MKSKLFLISVISNGILLLMVISLIFYFIICGKGITIDKTITNVSTSYSSSGSLAIGYIGGDYKGNWVIQEQKCPDIPAVYSVLQQIDPIQFINVKIISSKDNYYIYYPCINSSNVKKTTINGKEIK